MILLGLENCKPCKEMRAKHPELRYIEVPRSAGKDKQAINLKKRLNTLGIHYFPVVMNDGMTKVLPLSTIGE